jgi:hypothetical protein
MNKEFISYDQALALKELGFDEPCFKGYTEEYKTLIAFSNTHTNTSVRNTLPTKPFTAPLYQQAFRWFREKYGLNNFIYHYKKEGVINFAYNINDNIFESDFKTYEQAELECLKKLIEIVKSK